MKQIVKYGIPLNGLVLSSISLFLLRSRPGGHRRCVGTYKGATDSRTVGTMLDDSVLSHQGENRPYLRKVVCPARKIDVDVLSGVVYLSGVGGYQRPEADRIPGRTYGGGCPSCGKSACHRPMVTGPGHGRRYSSLPHQHPAH